MSDERMRRLERAAASGDPSAQAELTAWRRRYWPWESQAAECERQIEHATKVGHGRWLLFPQARRWRDLFEAEAPWQIERTFALPPELHGTDYRTVRSWISSHTYDLGLHGPSSSGPVGGGMLGERSIADERVAIGVAPDQTEASVSLRLHAPAGWAVRWQVAMPRPAGRRTRTRYEVMTIGPSFYLKSADGAHSTFYVKPRQEVLDALRAEMILVDGDTVSFEGVVRGEADAVDTTTLLVIAKYGQIIGSRWLGIIPALELPGGM